MVCHVHGVLQQLAVGFFVLVLACGVICKGCSGGRRKKVTRKEQDGNKHMRRLESRALTPSLISCSSNSYINFQRESF